MIPCYATRYPVRIKLTIPTGEVAANLTDFVTMIRLGDFPSKFWAKVKDDGGDIRVYNSSSTLIPHDIVGINKAIKDGAVFFKASLSTSSDNIFYITCGDSSLGALAVDNANGRNNVWSDYTSVFIGSTTNRVGDGNDLTLPNTLGSFMKYQKGTDLDFHQGVAWDGTYYYCVDTDEIVKYDSSWNEITRNATPLADTGIAGVNHCGDPEVVGSYLYIPIEEYPNTPYDNQHIGVFDTSTLDFITSYDISAQAREISGFGYNSSDGYLYVTDYTNGASVMRYTLGGVYVDTVNLSSSRSAVQGVTFWDGYMWITDDSDDTLHKYQVDGTYVGKVFTSFYGGSWEGISHNDNGLLVLVDAAAGVGGVYELRPAEDIYFGFQGFNGGGSAYAATTKHTSWTMGCSAVMSDLSSSTSHHGTLMYGPSGDGATQDTNKTGIIYRTNTSINWGFWNSTDSWLMSGASAPAIDTIYRLACTHATTSERKFYVNGTATTDTTVVQKPTGADCYLSIGSSRQNSTAEPFRGAIGLVYLRSGVLSADWLSAEASNWGNPSAFYTISIVEG